MLVRTELARPFVSRVYQCAHHLPTPLLMIFFLIMPALLGGFTNLLVPIQIGSAEMALPRLNAISFMLLPPSLLLLLSCVHVEVGAGVGWTVYPPLSRRIGIGVDVAIVSLHLSGLSSLASALPVVGYPLVSWLWGGLSVENATLNRFLSLHYLLPFIIAGNSVVHLAALHEVGSNHPLVGANPVDKSAFFTDSLIKDLVG